MNIEYIKYTSIIIIFFIQFIFIQLFIGKCTYYIIKCDSTHAKKDDVLFQTHIYILAISDVCFYIHLVFSLQRKMYLKIK